MISINIYIDVKPNQKNSKVNNITAENSTDKSKSTTEDNKSSEESNVLFVGALLMNSSSGSYI